MAIQLSGAVRDARLDAIETVIGTAAMLRIRTLSPPANCAAADVGTVLAEMALPSDWMAAASGGVKAKSGTWQDLTANAAGVAARFSHLHYGRDHLPSPGHGDGHVRRGRHGVRQYQRGGGTIGDCQYIPTYGR